MSAETFEVDTDLTRDAIYAGLWTRLCCELRGPAEKARLDVYIERFAVRRGEPTELLGYLDEDVDALTRARRELRTVEATPLGSLVHLDDVQRYMPQAWHEEGNRWIVTDGEIEEIENGGGHVVRVRKFGTDEQLRGDREEVRRSERW